MHTYHNPAHVIRWFISLALLSLSPTTFAASFEDGRQAYINQRYQEAFEILEPLAKSGKYEAQILIGVMYEYGHGVEKDPEKSFKWHKKAADQGIPAAQHDIGVKYFRGSGVKKNLGKAVQWWEKAADSGFEESQYNLALMYFHGQGAEKDIPGAIELFSRAAAKGHAQSQYNLGVLYAFGNGVEQDYAKARDLFLQAARQGYIDAQYNLGTLYENGDGVERNLGIAKSWFQRAARQGFAPAQKKLTDPKFRSVQTADTGVADSMDSRTKVRKMEELAPGADDAHTVATNTGTDTRDQQDQAAPPAPAVAKKTEQQTTQATAQTDYWADSRPRPIKTRSERGKNMTQPNSTAATTKTPVGKLDLSAWVRAQDKTHYVLQLISVGSKAHVLKFLSRHNLQKQGAGYVATLVNNATFYAAIYGHYTDAMQAKQAIRSLPAELQQSQPWARPIGNLQQYLLH